MLHMGWIFAIFSGGACPQTPLAMLHAYGARSPRLVGRIHIESMLATPLVVPIVDQGFSCEEENIADIAVTAISSEVWELCICCTDV